MHVMHIIQFPNDFLTTRSTPIQKGDTETLATLRTMAKYVENNDGAAGLALPQVGVSGRGFVMKIGTKVEIIINPVITKRSVMLVPGVEGCLSIPGQQVNVMRHTWVEVLYYDARFKVKKVRLQGWAARVFQHENDHLNGVLIVEKRAS
jgi:peptide deformylase